MSVHNLYFTIVTFRLPEEQHLNISSPNFVLWTTISLRLLPVVLGFLGCSPALLSVLFTKNTNCQIVSLYICAFSLLQDGSLKQCSSVYRLYTKWLMCHVSCQELISFDTKSKNCLKVYFFTYDAKSVFFFKTA